VNPPLQTEDIEDIETDAPVSAAKNVHDDVKQNGKLASNSIEPDSIDQMAYENLELAPATTTNVDTSDNGLLSSLVSDNGYYEEVKFSNGLKNKKQRKNSSEAAFDGDGDGDGSSYEDVVVNDDLSGAATNGGGEISRYSYNNSDYENVEKRLGTAAGSRGSISSVGSQFESSYGMARRFPSIRDAIHQNLRKGVFLKRDFRTALEENLIIYNIKQS
jgi:hypothetical protein